MVDKNDCKASGENTGREVAPRYEYATRAGRDIARAMRDPMFDPFFDMLAPIYNERHDPFRAFNRLFNAGLDDLTEQQREVDQRVRVYDEPDGSTTVNIDLPGVNKDDLSLTWPDDRTFRVDVSEKKENDKDHVSYRSETIQRSLDHEVDVKTAEAHLDNGVLTLSLKPAPETIDESRKTEIK